MKTVVLLSGKQLPKTYFETRYAVLREPLGAPKGSERIDGDDTAIHVYIEDKEQVISVGRAHLIPPNEDGSAMDKKANSSCPPFSPLSCTYRVLKDDTGNCVPHNLRPAFQIRQMGTLKNYRGNGLASKTLAALEENAVKLWGAKSGWLQARTEALPFYKANGWVCFEPEYEVQNVGPHRSMWKNFKTLNNSKNKT